MLTFSMWGNHGNFDRMVRSALKELKPKYLHIQYAVVLAYMPEKQNNIDYSDTIFPYGLEKTPKRYAIIKRNQWLVAQADIVVTYVTTSIGGAAQFQEIAKKKGKKIINLAIK